MCVCVCGWGGGGWRRGVGGGVRGGSCGGGGGGGGEGRRKSDELQSMTRIRMGKSWDDVGCSQRDSQEQPGEGELH